MKQVIAIQNNNYCFFALKLVGQKFRPLDKLGHICFIKQDTVTLLGMLVQKFNWRVNKPKIIPMYGQKSAEQSSKDGAVKV